MRSLLLFLSGGVLAFSVSACGAGSGAPKSLPPTNENEDWGSFIVTENESVLESSSNLQDVDVNRCFRDLAHTTLDPIAKLTLRQTAWADMIREQRNHIVLQDGTVLKAHSWRVFDVVEYAATEDLELGKEKDRYRCMVPEQWELLELQQLKSNVNNTAELVCSDAQSFAGQSWCANGIAAQDGLVTTYSEDQYRRLSQRQMFWSFDWVTSQRSETSLKPLLEPHFKSFPNIVHVKSFSEKNIVALALSPAKAPSSARLWAVVEGNPPTVEVKGFGQDQGLNITAKRLDSLRPWVSQAGFSLFDLNVPKGPVDLNFVETYHDPALGNQIGETVARYNLLSVGFQHTLEQAKLKNESVYLHVIVRGPVPSQHQVLVFRFGSLGDGPVLERSVTADDGLEFLKR